MEHMPEILTSDEAFYALCDTMRAKYAELAGQHDALWAAVEQETCRVEYRKGGLTMNSSRQPSLTAEVSVGGIGTRGRKVKDAAKADFVFHYDAQDRLRAIEEPKNAVDYQTHYIYIYEGDMCWIMHYERNIRYTDRTSFKSNGDVSRCVYENGRLTSFELGMIGETFWLDGEYYDYNVQGQVEGAYLISVSVLSEDAELPADVVFKGSPHLVIKKGDIIRHGWYDAYEHDEKGYIISVRSRRFDRPDFGEPYKPRVRRKV